MKFDRVYVPVWMWEEVPAGMWSEIESKQEAMAKAIAFTGDYKLYGSWMTRVVNEWPNSCLNALTDYSLNRKAWLGHSAVAMAIGIPEDITRAAWARLSDEQRLLANKEAERAIKLWEDNYSKSRGIHKDMGGQMLFGWNTR